MLGNIFSHHAGERSRCNMPDSKKRGRYAPFFACVWLRPPVESASMLIFPCLVEKGNKIDQAFVIIFFFYGEDVLPNTFGRKATLPDVLDNIRELIFRQGRGASSGRSHMVFGQER